MKYRNPGVQKLSFIFKKENNGWIAFVIFRPIIGLLYHSTVARKDISAGAIVSVTHALDYFLRSNEDF